MVRLAMMDLDTWQETAPYIDTLFLPIYSLSIQEKKVQLQKGREVERVAHLVEKALTGRVLLLPAISYTGSEVEVFDAYLQQVITELKQSGFHHLVVISHGQLPMNREQGIMQWVLSERDQPLSDQELEAQAESCKQQILDLWVKNT